MAIATAPVGQNNTGLNLSGGVTQSPAQYQTSTAPSNTINGVGPNTAATFTTQAPAAAAATTGTSAGGNSGTATVDPNAAKIAALITSGTNAAVAGGQGGTSEAAGNLSGLGNSLATTVQTGQNSIDEARKNIGLSQINSIKQLANTIHQGLQGTGVQLGNTNALDSSAADAAARAYSNYGNVQTNSINNSAATGNEDQDVNQKNLDITSTNGLASIKAARDSAIGTIQAQASQALQGLATTIAYMGGDASKINVQAIQAQIVQNAQDQLAQIDQNITNLIGGVAPASADQTATAAEAASNAGVVPSSGTSFQTTNPTGATATNSDGSQLGGAPTSLIPLVVGKPQNQTTGP